jgi:hypothetical protein
LVDRSGFVTNEHPWNRRLDRRMIGSDGHDFDEEIGVWVSIRPPDAPCNDPWRELNNFDEPYT